MGQTTEHSRHGSPSPPISQPSQPIVFQYVLFGLTPPTTYCTFPFPPPLPFQVGPAQFYSAPPLGYTGGVWNAPYFMAQSQPTGAPESVESLTEHPLGPPQLLFDGFAYDNVGIDQTDLLDDSVPAPIPNTYSNPSNFLIHDNYFPYPHDTLGIAVDHAHFNVSSFQDTAYSPTFLEKREDTCVPGVETQESALGGLDTQSHWPTQSTPGADFASPTMPRSSRALVHHRPKTPKKQPPTDLTPSPLFVRSVSAPLRTALRPPSVRPDIPARATTCPSTPRIGNNHFTRSHSPTLSGTLTFNLTADTRLQSVHGSQAQDVPDDTNLPSPGNPVRSDEYLRHGIRRRRSDSDMSEMRTNLDGSFNQESEAQPQSKRIRLIVENFDNVIPTNTELNANIEVEYGKLQGKRKYHAKQGVINTTDTKKGPTMSSFPEDQQAYMTVARSSIVWDQLTRSPWSESDESLVDRAIERADTVTQMEGEKFIREGGFITTMMRTVWNCRSRYIEVGMKLAREGYSIPEGEGKQHSQELNAVICSWVSGDRFMFGSDKKDPDDFFKNPVAIDMTVELFFTSGSNLGGIFMQDLLCPEEPEARRRLFALVSKFNPNNPPVSFDYADMSTDALCGPPIAAMAFAGIILKHALQKLNDVQGKGKRKGKGKGKGMEGKGKEQEKQTNRSKSKSESPNFNEANYGELWRSYVRMLTKHPQLGWIRASILEKMKYKYVAMYRKDTRNRTSEEPRAWKWRYDLAPVPSTLDSIPSLLV